MNGALAIDWERPPLELLDALLAIEARMGRIRTVKDGPRTIDLDVLWARDFTSADPRLVVPHPRLAQRAFAIAPLLEVAPDAPYGVPGGGASEVVPRPELGSLFVGSEK